jgi:hypothetical protein
MMERVMSSFSLRPTTGSSGIACRVLDSISVRIWMGCVGCSDILPGVYYSLFTVGMLGTAYGMVSLVKVITPSVWIAVS